MPTDDTTVFEQPRLETPEAPAQPAAELPPGVSVASRVPLRTTNVGKTDELSLAAKAPPVNIEPPAPPPPGKYALDYEYRGELIHETHIDIPHALARIRSLKVRGITPATSTIG